jgi:hypothetical protein
MAKTKISEFSATPANNTDIDSINIAEGCAPSGINDAIRELMAQLKDFQTGAVGDSFNGPIGTTTAAAGAFTTLSASSTLGVTGVSTLTGGAVVQGLTVGRGAGAVATNTAVGASALLATNTGGYTTGVGNAALQNNTSGAWNSALGFGALNSNSSGSYSVAVGGYALVNTTASESTAVGYQAGYGNTTGGVTAFGAYSGYTNQTGEDGTFIGKYAGYFTTGSYNCFVGRGTAGGSGQSVTTGSRNTIIGSYTGNNDGLDIRTASNYAVISDGDGNRQITMKEGQTLALDSAVPNAGTGITFPATQSASSNANTLDDYEEGTFTATLTCTTSGTITLGYNTLYYTKIGRQVTILGYLSITAVSSPTGNLQLNGLPFSVLGGNIARPVLNVRADGLAATAVTALVGELAENTTTGTIFKYSAGSLSALASSIPASSNIVVTATYFTS